MSLILNKMTKQEQQAIIDEAKRNFKGKSGIPYSNSDKIARNVKGRREEIKKNQFSRYLYYDDPRTEYRIKSRKSFD